MAITRDLVRKDLQRYYGRHYCARTPKPNENIFKNCFAGDRKAWETTGDDINHTFWWIPALPSLLKTKDMRESTTINHLVTRIFRNRRPKMAADEFRTVVLASAQLMADDPRALKKVEKFVLEQVEAPSTKTRGASKSRSRAGRHKKATPRSRAGRRKKATPRKRKAA